MKIDEFLKNPMGKGAIIPGRDSLLQVLDYRLELMHKNKEVVMNIYTKDNDVYYHFLIPTESNEKENTYDVIIKFVQTEKSDKFDDSYRRYQIKFFSNCPSFTYGYAYVANLNGYLIEEFANRYNSKVLKYPPVSKNPGLVFGYEKSIYFACRSIINDKHVLLKSYVKSYGKPLTKEVLKSIRHMNVIEEEIARANKVMRENRKQKAEYTKKQEKRKDELIKRHNHEGDNKKSVNVVKKVKASKPTTVKTIKKKK